MGRFRIFKARRPLDSTRPTSSGDLRRSNIQDQDDLGRLGLLHDRRDGPSLPISPWWASRKSISPRPAAARYSRRLSESYLRPMTLDGGSTCSKPVVSPVGHKPD